MDRCCRVIDMTTAPIHTAEYDPDEFTVCETCDRTVLRDEAHEYEEAGITVCGPCDEAERDYWMRQCAPAMPSLDQLRREEEDTIAACGYGSDEAIKARTLVNLASR